MNLKPQDLAKRWGMHVDTLAHWRIQGRGPRFFKFGSRVFYPLAEVEAWERAHLFGSVAEATSAKG